LYVLLFRLQDDVFISNKHAKYVEKQAVSAFCDSKDTSEWRRLQLSSKGGEQLVCWSIDNFYCEILDKTGTLLTLK